MFTIDYAREQLESVDSDAVVESQTPANFRNINYAELNGIDGLTDSEDPTSWDFARFAEAN